MYSVQLFYNKSLILSLILIVVCLRVFIFAQCECCCPGSGRPVLCCTSPTAWVTSSARPVAKPQRSEITAQQLLIYQECLPWLQRRGPARSVLCNGCLTGLQRCRAALPARGPGLQPAALWPDGRAEQRDCCNPRWKTHLDCVCFGWLV